MWLKKHQQNLPISGELLVAEFHSAFTNLVTMETAKYEAQRSEQDTLHTLENLGVQNGLFVTPNDIPADAKEKLVKSSFDAHLKKAQSQQLTQAALQQVAYQEQEVKKRYVGKKVTANNLDSKVKPFESVWQNKNNGQYTNHSLNTRIVKGRIEDISFSGNVVVLRPNYVSRILSPGRKYFLIYVINPESFEPAISISLL